MIHWPRSDWRNQAAVLICWKPSKGCEMKRWEDFLLFFCKYSFIEWGMLFWKGKWCRKWAIARNMFCISLDCNQFLKECLLYDETVSAKRCEWIFLTWLFLCCYESVLLGISVPWKAATFFELLRLLACLDSYEILGRFIQPPSVFSLSHGKKIKFWIRTTAYLIETETISSPANLSRFGCQKC